MSELGDNITLTCSSQGGPNNTYQWMKSELVLENEIEATLNLYDITAVDGGSYTCTVSNIAGSESASSFLYIRPYFTREPKTELLSRVNDKANFTCEADGFPVPSIIWMKLDSNMILVEEVSVNSVLSFEPVQFGDEGYYQCVANSTLEGLDLSVVLRPPSLLVGKLQFDP